MLSTNWRFSSVEPQKKEVQEAWFSLPLSPMWQWLLWCSWQIFASLSIICISPFILLFNDTFLQDCILSSTKKICLHPPTQPHLQVIMQKNNLVFLSGKYSTFIFDDCWTFFKRKELLNSFHVPFHCFGWISMPGSLIQTFSFLVHDLTTNVTHLCVFSVNLFWYVYISTDLNWVPTFRTFLVSSKACFLVMLFLFEWIKHQTTLLKNIGDGGGKKENLIELNECYDLRRFPPSPLWFFPE